MALPISMSSQSSPTLQPPAAAAHPSPVNPRGTWNVCCGGKLSWRDIYMITLELGTIGAGTASFMLNQDPHLSGTFVTIAGFEILTHALWRRDALIADEHRVSVTLRSPVVQRDEHESSVTTIKTEEIFQSSIRELKSVADPV